MIPERIVILGNAGSGKSTLARRIGARSGSPVIHLDRLFWQPGWQEPEAERFRERVSAAVSGPRWICEGNYPRRTFDLRLPRADLVIWMDTPRLTCLGRVIRRNLRGGVRPDSAPGCPELLNRDFLIFLKYVWRFEQDHRPKIEMARLHHGAAVPVVRLRGSAAITAFLAGLPEGASPAGPGSASSAE